MSLIALNLKLKFYTRKRESDDTWICRRDIVMLRLDPATTKLNLRVSKINKKKEEQARPLNLSRQIYECI